jgi:hypothetical protein
LRQKACLQEKGLPLGERPVFMRKACFQEEGLLSGRRLAFRKKACLARRVRQG